MAFTVPTIFKAVDKYTSVLDKMSMSTKKFGDEAQKNIARIERRFRRVSDVSNNISKGLAVGGLAIAAPLILAGKQAVDFEDKMADIAKTTGLEGDALKKLGQSILDVSTGTRSSIEQLQDIARIGGQMGIAKNELEAFIVSADKFNVALGEDFAGGTEEAVTSVAKLKSLFKETRGLNISDSITKAGSAINFLSGKGKASAQNITEFMLRVGALPDALKPSIQSAAALGTVLEESGIDAEVGSRSFGILVQTAGKELGKFAKQMSLSQTEASNLLSQDPSVFAAKFAESLKGLKPEVLASKLKDLGIGADGVIKLVGALGSNTKRLGDLQGFANDSFKEGTSLLDEFNTKNETMAAKLKKAQNNFKAISITIGTELIPIVSDLLKEFLPIIKSFSQWIKDNPERLKTFVKMAAGLSAVMFALSGIAKVVTIASFAMANFKTIKDIATSPITLIILAIAALAAAVYIVINKWNEWGAAVTGVAMIIAPFFSPILAGIALVISAVVSFSNHWDKIGKAFSEGRILDGILEIGVALLDVVLMPLQQILELISKIPGLDFAADFATDIRKFRAELGINTSELKEGETNGTPLINPKLTEQETLTKRIEKNTKESFNLNIRDFTGRAEMEDTAPPYINLSSTVGDI